MNKLTHIDKPANTAADMPSGIPASIECSASLTAVLHSLQTGDFQSRWEAAKLIPTFGEAAILPLLELLQQVQAGGDSSDDDDDDDDDDDWQLLWFIARILGQFQHPLAISALVEILFTTDDTETLTMAAMTLATIGPAAIPPLSELLARPSSRLIAVQALAQIQHPNAIPALLSVMEDVNPQVRAAAMEALSHFRSSAITAMLVAALRDPNVPVRRAAVVALGIQAEAESPVELVEHLTPLLWDLNLEVCRQTAIALGRIGTEAAIHVLDRVLQSPHTPVELQMEVARALAWIDSALALRPLKTYLIQTASSGSDSLILAQEIVAVLGRVESPESRSMALEILLSLLHTAHPISQISSGKQQIALSLGQLQDASAIDALISMLSDANTSVQFHVIAALKQLAAHGAYDRLQTLLASDAVPADLKAGIANALREWQIHTEL
ncbi:HEAT repeat domain-containing protein [Leptolyngbya sp. 7M]|uniref:HEAT repeat domain-containing protein n=1 Tax=Leptolyngbya sp. 7M TaxID=2812896 RepID=UPI001B8B24C8|nr:HEAT repeat domain-containing protein [Leptolyngbya sp. 7M]QYO67985.1 HEAT repeat domain-containing protein [Leptolyngbya sp. 7M]